MRFQAGCFIAEAPCFPFKLPLRRCCLPRGRVKAILPSDYFYKTLVIYFSFYELKNVQFIAFHRDNSYQISDKTTQILAA